MKDQTRKTTLTQSLEKDQRAKQTQANAIFEQKMAAEAAGDVDLANKLGRDYKEKQLQIRKIDVQLKTPLDPRTLRDMRLNAEEKVMAGADVLLSTLSSSCSREE